jgi:FkbM family methyltransferase
MGRPKRAVPDFDDQLPWGAHVPASATLRALRWSHAMPPALAPLTKWLRRSVKYGATTPLDLEVWGLRLRLMPRGNMSEQKLYTAPQLFDREEFALMKRRLGPGGVFVDVGANAGVYSFWAHRCMGGQGRIIAVEPDPEMRRRIAFNVRTNGLTELDLCPVALSDREGTADLLVNPGQRGENTLDSDEARRAGSARQTLTVPVKTLLGLLQERAVNRVDVLKIDIEGHEPPVLRHFLQHAPSSLWPGAVISEFKNQTAGDILALLAERGYRRRETTKLNFILERP